MIAVILGFIFGVLSLLGTICTMAALRLGWLIVIVKVIIDVVAGLGLLTVLGSGLLTVLAVIAVGVLGLIFSLVSAFLCATFLDQ